MSHVNPNGPLASPPRPSRACEDFGAYAGAVELNDAAAPVGVVPPYPGDPAMIVTSPGRPGGTGRAVTLAFAAMILVAALLGLLF
jgi:hypothetical protein